MTEASAPSRPGIALVLAPPDSTGFSGNVLSLSLYDCNFNASHSSGFSGGEVQAHTDSLSR